MNMLEAAKTLRQLNRRKRLLNQLGFGDQASDFFLVSFPKSGNSWVRVTIAYLLNPEVEEIAFHNLHNFIPDTEVADQLPIIQDRQSSFYQQSAMIAKSHDYYTNFYRQKKVIYIVRNGVDAITSYYHYLNARTEVEVDKNLFLDKGSAKVKSWRKHVSGWREAFGQNVLLVKYEQLIQQPELELDRIATFLKLTVTSHEIDRAVSNAAFERMKELEEKYGYFNKTQIKKDENAAFVRKGKAGEKSDVFSKEQIEYFVRKSSKELDYFGYL